MTENALTNLDTLRVDQVGSLLRPAKLKETFARHLQGVASAEELRQVQDEVIREVIATQEAHNLPIITDGEFRRFQFMESFADVAGFEQWWSGFRNVLQNLAQPGEIQDKPLERGLDPILMVR